MPEPTAPYYLTFQRELGASEHVRTIARMLAHTHWLYEGWRGLPLPLTGELKRIYERAAAYAVRFCSTVEQHCAVKRAERWGLHAFDALEENLRSCDTTRDDRAELIRAYVRQCLDVERHALMHGSHVLSPQEQAVVMETIDLPEAL